MAQLMLLGKRMVGWLSRWFEYAFRTLIKLQVFPVSSGYET